MPIRYSCKLIPRIPMRNQGRDLNAPTKMCLGKVVRSHLKVAARCIHAAQHDLIVQHQLPDEFSPGDLEGPVAARNAGNYEDIGGIPLYVALALDDDFWSPRVPKNK
jgi:hypothetical protein